MSTTIDVYPATSAMPLVEDTRARTQELLQELLDRHDVGSTVEVTAFYPSASGRVRRVGRHVRWRPDMELGFSYWIDGTWDSSSWPSCWQREEGELVSESDLADGQNVHGYAPEFLSRWYVVAELGHRLSAEKLAAIESSDHEWSEYRSAAGPAVASTGLRASGRSLG